MKAPRMPKMGRHSSGQARVTLNGKIHYLGKYGSVEAHEKYAELVKRWLAGDRRSMQQLPHAGQATVTVRDLFARYREWIEATGKYRKAGVATSQRHLVELALRGFEAHAGDVRATRLTAGLIVQWRDVLEQQQQPRLTRPGINDKVQLLLQALRWAKDRGLLTREVWNDCRDIRPLQRGECGDRPDHGRQRRAVSLADVWKVADACTCRHVAAMLRVQALLGCRPGEICMMRWADIDKASPVVVDGVSLWTYRVPQASGKTAHHGRSISYPVPPAAQAILEQFPAPPLALIFSPAASMAERGRSRKTAPAFGVEWNARTYRQALTRACRVSGVPYFTSHEIRHGAITRAAEAFGVLAAQRLANHSSSTTTARYLHADDMAAYRVAAAATVGS